MLCLLALVLDRFGRGWWPAGCWRATCRALIAASMMLIIVGALLAAAALLPVGALLAAGFVDTPSRCQTSTRSRA